MSRYTYNTKQKTLIMSLLEKEKEAPLSCDSIVAMLVSEGTPVGKTTVYRFLENLAAKGEVRKFVDSHSKTATFQLVDKSLNCAEHMHLRCVGCGRIVHLGCEFMSEVGTHIFEHHGFTVDNSKTVILGKCENCKE